ncbi:MAG: STAS domain-containing protein [Thermomonas sp.]|jgi:SulP family sulfate permease|uniref:SulP family inorganic anion transporter n=2 Tax=Thermomonas sp. TaxID=1971895 RepID=UPI001B5CC641|nr:STAS domain-containing protein [Thermomonas sp.]MBK9668451.1 STAS domain-containing protein [Thermomonas sp.]MBP6438992.1 STAS domain-containing protein [Thermomonas sp.]HRA03386.1 SulP family inorganic anion transporter [Thermomonas sp.]HWR95142.1 SulP family inorganic anion transporter [Arenimonas sp.]
MNTPRQAAFAPKLWTVLRNGYRGGDFRHDAVAGLTVAIVALPLAMALAIASGTTPDKGLVTTVVAGLLISALGGTRFQIGGPTGAFIPVVYVVISAHGFDGLVLATLMAGILLVFAGLMKVGALMRFMPQPLVTGFTSGIAVIIAASQLKDALGLPLETVPAEFIPRIRLLAAHLGEANPTALALAAGSVALIVGLRRHAPRAPGFLLAVLLSAALVALAGLQVDTIASRFGGIPSSLPMPQWPALSLERLLALVPAALTIAFLAGIESLLSAVVADGMSGGKHRPNTELVAQGVANVASALVGGLPATGAIARTATNIRSGARSPLAGVLHAVFVLGFMLLLAPLAGYVPLPTLAGVLLVVAWNMSEREHFMHTLRAPKGDRAVLLATFATTVLVDLTFAIEVGIVIAAFVFMSRMADVVEVQSGLQLSDGDDAPEDLTQRARVPHDVQVYRISGPLFFGATGRLESVLDDAATPPRAYILRMGQVPMVDASGVHALKTLYERCRRRGTQLVISGLRAQPRRTLARMPLSDHGEGLHLVGDFEQALALVDTLHPAPATPATLP